MANGIFSELSDVIAPPIRILPDHSLLIGKNKLTEGSAGQLDHFYGATGLVTRSNPLAGHHEVSAAVREATKSLPAFTL